MKVLEKIRFQKEYVEKRIKPKCFFNPDGSVAVFAITQEDQLVQKWVYEKGAALKNEGFSLNSETYDQILKFIMEGGSFNEAPPEIILEPEEQKPIVQEGVKTPSQGNRSEIIELLKSKKLKVAELQEILIKILEL